MRCSRPKNSGDYRRDCLTAIPCLAPTLPKLHYPSPRTTTLASLVKGRWIDGKAQTVALLRPACDMSALFILQTFLPSRRRDCLSCTQPLYPHNHCKRTTHPCSALNLPPLSKVRCCRPKKIGRLPEGLPHHYPSPLTNPPKTALSLAPHHHTCLPCQREVD